MSARICECKSEEVRKGHKPGVLIKINSDIILATYGGWVSLNDPRLIWGKESFFNGLHLPKGTCVEYVSEV